jgi:chemotaxis protein CheZ
MLTDDQKDAGGKAAPAPDARGEALPEAGAAGNSAPLAPDDPRIAQARQLLAHLESGNAAEADRVLGEIACAHDTGLFQEVGRLTRELHEALNAFRNDTRLASLANVDIPDAKERLHYVVSMTEQAASRTLSAVEESRPVCEELRARALGLHEDWRRFLERKMDVTEFRALSARLDEFLPWAEAGAARVGGNLSEALMAQGFQDLTGQIIGRVIKLVEEVEDSLVNLVRIAGQRSGATPEPAARPADALEGPQVPRLRQSDAVSGQDEVDDLLSSLGF